MNFRSATIAAVSVVTALFSAYASASEATLVETSGFVATQSRAEVRHAVLQARSSSALFSGEVSTFVETQGMALSRGQVAAEACEAVRLGIVGGNDHGYEPTAAQWESIRQAGAAALSSSVAMR